MSSRASSSRRRPDSGDLEDRNFDPVFVYCRVRPLAFADISNVVIKDQTTVILTAPNHTTLHKPSLDQETRYVFKHVFGPTCTQDKVYKVVAQPLVEKLILGGSSLLFTYGVTGSGKTYTMTGDTRELGVMPRCLEAIFRSIEGFHAREFIFQPDHLNGFEIVSEAEASTRSKMEKHQRSVLGQRASQRFKSIEAEYELKVLEDIVALPGVDERNVYAVFISYIEVYNNCVYDLLEECSVQRTLQSRMVREDSNHNMYVHGVTEMEIRSVSDALDAFRIGQRHKRIGHTVLNAESSRSHAVFNIRLVQAPTGEHARDNRSVITISQLSLVDLAGSERSSRTNNYGARLREAGNINNSLMTLRSCLQYLRENQQSANGSTIKKIPYRDSKITQLFKNFFEGEGQVSMIVCINPSLEDFAENSQVMRFAELTQEVQIPRAMTTVQVSTNENDIVNLLRSKFLGYEFDIPSGDGPLSEKLIFMFQQYLEKSKKDTTELEEQCEMYRKNIAELELENKELTKKNEENEFLHKITSELNETIAKLRERLQDQTIRLDRIEQDFGRVRILKPSNEMQNEKSVNELMTSSVEASAPKKINFKLINKFIELTERDEM